MLLFDQELLVIHDGLTSVVHLTSDWPGIISLTIVGPDDARQGEIVLQALDDGYGLLWRTASGEQWLPLLTWPRQGKRVRDMLPHYAPHLSPQAYQALTDEDTSNLLLPEFCRLLGKAVAHDTDPRPVRHKQRRKWQSLYGAGLGLKPPIVRELAALFLASESRGV